MLSRRLEDRRLEDRFQMVVHLRPQALRQEMEEVRQEALPPPPVASEQVPRT